MPFRLIPFFRCIRYAEVVIFQVPPLLGIAFTNPFWWDELPSLFFFFLGNICLFVLIFAFNDWGDIDLDSKDVNKRESTFTQKGVSPRQILLVTVALTGLVLFVFYMLGVVTFLLALVMIGLGFLYSHPRFAQKRIPIVASMNHFMGGVTMFLLGYSLFSEIDPRGIAISLYFAVVFMAGHLCQEVRDYDQDKLNCANTSAVRFGKRQIFLIAFILFILSFGYFLWLVKLGFFPLDWIYAIALLLVIASGFFYAWKTPLSFHDVCRFQAQYRLVFAIITGFMLLSLLFTPITR
jgi:4-hydroxybenzoate polyprenyltransferase